MKRSEHFNVVAGKWLHGYSLSVTGRKYAISGVSPDNKYDGGVPTYYFVDAFTDVSGIFTVVFSYLDSVGKSLQYNVIKQQ